jgi:glutaminyl-peptide cyclotransferase
MKNSFLPVALIFILFISFFSCSNKPKRSRKPVSAISVYPGTRNYIYGQSVSVQIKTKVKNGELASASLYHNGRFLKKSNKLEFSVENIHLNKLGRNSFRVSAIKKDSVSNSRMITVNVLSDITPEKYTYKIKNNFPHNNKFFTQGLEFHEGFLYEGTGEKGSSGLYKVDLLTGNIMQKHLLNKEYFGEGITILGQKIYQLTYRAQKGFIYNLSDFAVLDSFSFKSKEGWGLTNDGQYLIMSNGSRELIWLDPEDLSEVKKIEVANDRSIITNLNELEYIDGSIYANVYTTNLIIEIDPENGKVLSEINMEGIIDLFQTGTDEIDYLNGIAWDKENDRLFITGKWWPRLFEIERVPLE